MSEQSQKVGLLELRIVNGAPYSGSVLHESAADVLTRSLTRPDREVTTQQRLQHNWQMRYRSIASAPIALFCIDGQLDASRVMGVALASPDSNLRRITLEHLAVSPEFRSRGIGKQLLQHVFAHAAMLGVHELFTTSVESPHQLYTDFGFTETEEGALEADYCDLRMPVLG